MIVVLCAVLGAGVFSSASYGSSVEWKKDLAKSLDAAKKSKKYVIVDVYTDW